MAKFPEANVRKFQDIFICKRCKSKMRVPNRKVLAGKVSCRSCDYKYLRVKRKK